MIDEIDRCILAMLQENGRVSNAEIARKVEMAPSAILERIRKLEDRGLIEGYAAKLNPAALGHGLLAYIFVRTAECIGDGSTGAALADVPEVQEVHHVAGEDCYLVKVRSRNPETLGQLLREKIGAIPNIRHTRTTIVLETVKEASTIPLEIPEEVSSHA